MADREILRVEIDDSEFSEFKRKFDEYESAVKAMPAQWKAASTEITVQKTNFEKLVDSAGKLYHSMEQATIAQSASSRFLEGAGVAWLGIHRTGKLFHKQIHDATASLRHWTKLTAVFSGILGAGGLFGINRMAESVARQRTSATGLGVTYGEQASFLTNFGRLGNAEGILQGFSEAETDVSKRYALRQYLGHTESGDPARDFAEGLGRFKEFVDKTPQELLESSLHARGYDRLGLGAEQARIIRGMSAAEIAQIGSGYRGDVAGRLGLSDTDAKKWTEFTNQMERAGREIETVFAKRTVKLTKPLEHLSDSFVNLTANLLKDGSPIHGWIKDLGKGIKNFADELGSGAVQANAANIGKDIADTIKLFDAIVAKTPGGLAVLLGMAAGARVGGAAVAAGTAIARSGAVAAVGAGAAAVGALVPGAAAVTALGGAIIPQPLNRHEDEKERQRRFHQGPFAPEHMKQRHIFGHPPHYHKGSLDYFERGGYGPFSQNAAFGRDLNIPGPTVPHMGEGGIVTKPTVALVGESGPEAIVPLSGFNLGNIRARKGGWRKFETASDAAHAIVDQLSRYKTMFPRQHDINTLSGAIKRYSPRRDRNKPAEYARQVEQWTGIPRNATMALEDPEFDAALAYGITRKEGHLGTRSLEDFRGMFVRHGEPLRRSFGHFGHHPATMARKDARITVQDNTGGMVSMGAH